MVDPGGIANWAQDVTLMRRTIGPFEQAFMEIRCPDDGDGGRREDFPATVHDEIHPTGMLSVVANLAHTLVCLITIKVLATCTNARFFLFTKMFGSIFGWRKEQEEDLRKPLIAGKAEGKEPLGRRICKALRSFWITQTASIYILKLPPPHVRACLFDNLSSFCNRPKKTPESIKYMLKNHDIAEAFIVTVLRYLGFKQVGSNIDLHRLSDSGRYLAHTLAENCFTRDLLEKYKSIDWAAAAAAGDLPVPQEMPLELVARLPADGQWRQPLADWIKRFASIIHSKVFPLEPYAEIEAKVNFLLYSFIHDLMEAQLQVFGRIML